MSRTTLPPISQLKGVLTVLDNRSKRSPAVVLSAVRDMVQDAIAVLQEPDPIKQRIGFVLLAFRESTELREVTIRGKLITKVKVLDLALYNWAMAEVHQMASGWAK